MDVTSLALVASKLHLWMDANVADEREPQTSGQQAGAWLREAALAAQPTTPAHLALLTYVAEVLEAYAGHVHAVAYVPTPREAAKDAADRLRKMRLPDPPAPTSGAPVSVAAGIATAPTPSAPAATKPKPAKS